MASSDGLSAVTDVEQEKRPSEDLSLQVEEEEAQYPDLSVATQILLTGSLTLAMMLNVSHTSLPLDGRLCDLVAELGESPR